MARIENGVTRAPYSRKFSNLLFQSHKVHAFSSYIYTLEQCEQYHASFSPTQLRQCTSRFLPYDDTKYIRVVLKGFRSCTITNPPHPHRWQCTNLFSKHGRSSCSCWCR